MYMKRYIKSLLRESLNILGEDYFNTTIDKDSKRLSNKYQGRNVVWYGYPGRMALIHKDLIHGMWGNLYDYDKLEYLKNLILTHDEDIEIECSYGIASVVTLQDIIEHQISVVQDSWAIDYEGHSEPYTIGDELLDLYLGVESLDDDNDLFDLQLYDNYEVMSLMDSYKTLIAHNPKEKDEFIAELADLDIELTESDKETIKNFFEFENNVRNAVANKDGDLDTLSVQLRDGHHRVFGAIAAGEQYVCVNLDEESIENYGDYITLI